MFDSCFTPCKIGKLEIPNRFVMPGMGNAKGTWDGYATDELTEWYCARARGGMGLIINEITAIEPNAPQGPSQAAIWDDSYIPGYRKMTDAVHAAGNSKIFCQLHHAGREGDELWNGQAPVAVSKIPCPLHRDIPRVMTTEEVWDIIHLFGDAALRAKKAGFDGVEVHGAHGYLPAQFMSMLTNKRTDEFGGDLAGRAKFGIEMVRDIKSKCGEDFPVMLRFSGDEKTVGGRHVRETVMYLQLLEDAGLDAVNISVGTYASMEYTITPAQIPIAFNMDDVEFIKKKLRIPVCGVGRVNDPLVADMLIREGVCDFVAMGRASIADAEFPNKAREGRLAEICPCIGCMTRCSGFPGAPGFPQTMGISCAMNPMSGWEASLKILPAKNPKRVVVVGGGPAGMEAAWIAAAEGHKVTLLEKAGQLGGQALIACMPPNKSEIARAVRYWKTMCEKYGVDVRLGVDADAEAVLALKPDAVIVAAGSTPVMPRLENEGIEVVFAVDIVKGDILCGENVLVLGGGLVGLETAEYIVGQNRKASIVEMQSAVGADVHFGITKFILEELKARDALIYTNTAVKRFTKDGAVCETPDGELVLKGYDMVAMAVGSKPDNALVGELKNKVKEVYAVGDAVAVGKIAQATDWGMHMALKLNET